MKLRIIHRMPLPQNKYVWSNKFN